MRKFTIAGIGELLWDVLPETEVIGGAPVNFAYHVTALGARGIPISTIGRDPRGEKALVELQKRGVDIAAISISDEFVTGYVSATVDEEGKATYSFPDEVAWDHLMVNEYAENLRSVLDGICFGSLAQRSEHSRRAIHGFLDTLRPETVKVFDINFRQNFYSKQVIESSLRRTDILKLNEEELFILARLLELKGSSDKWLPALIKLYRLEMAILSRGDSGSLLMTPEKSSEHPGIVTHVEDTIGAGDSFTAAATIGYLRGMALDDINEQANRIAAYVCSQRGGMPHVPESMTE
ncbi:MAG: carbohydrate kinase [Desulforhopalus sp.]|nr:carbohydrate kinase [Desulforhopalus sp.]